MEEIRRRFPRAIIDRYLDRVPSVGESAFIAPGASVVGDVRLGVGVLSVWYGAVLRGDIVPVIIGDRSNVQDGTVIHVADDGPCVVGADVVVGHQAHTCTWSRSTVCTSRDLTAGPSSGRLVA